jgi:hypothetical protein
MRELFILSMKVRLLIPMVAVGVLALLSLGVVAAGAKALSTVTLSLRSPGAEHTDKYIPGLNTEEKAPDYGIEVRVGQAWETIGVRQNQFLGEESLRFEVQSSIPIRAIQEIRVIDDDPIEDDVLERLDFHSGKIVGQGFVITSSTRFDLASGLELFWTSTVGKAVLLGLAVGIALVIFRTVMILGPF